MAIDIRVRRFTGSYSHLNGVRAAESVGVPELVNKALTVGGVVRGSALQKSRRRAAIANMVLSSVQTPGATTSTAPLGTTRLYDHTETTEKSGISFRLGMAFAAVTAGRVLNTASLKHVNGVGRRADLIGFDRSGDLHVVEAKCRTYGLGDPRVLSTAKTQATATAGALRAAGRTVATASASLTDLSTSPINVLLEDPPLPDDEVQPLELDDVEYFSEYYSPVLDLLQATRQQPSGVPEVDEIATGAFLTSEVWIGLSNEVTSHLDGGGDPSELRTWASDRTAIDLESVSMTSDGHVLVLGAAQQPADLS